MRSPESLFRVPPFPAFPSVSRYVPVGSVAEAEKRLVRCVESRESVALVIGPPGTGKTLLANVLAESFGGTRQVAALGDSPIDSPAAFYRQLLHQIGVGQRRMADGELHLALSQRLRSDDAPEPSLLLIVDEAQSLSPEVLEAIRMVTNIMRRDEPRVTVILCGGPALDDALAAPSLEPLSQRVATRCYLHPMTSEETRAYIESSIRACGADPDDTITEEAIAAVHHASGGIPRLVNQLMTETIDSAESAGDTLISEPIVDRAWAHLQQLPSPVVETPTYSHSAKAASRRDPAGRGASPEDAESPHPIEFGDLTEPDTLPSRMLGTGGLAGPVARGGSFKKLERLEKFESVEAGTGEESTHDVIEYCTPPILTDDERMNAAAFGDGATEFSPRDVAPILSELTRQDLLLGESISYEELERIRPESSTPEVKDEIVTRSPKGVRSDAGTPELSNPLPPHADPVTPHADPVTPHADPVTPHADPVTPHADPVTLFGDFDEEEELIVGGVLTNLGDDPVSGRPIASGTAASSGRLPESMLHEQVVGIIEEVTSAREGARRGFEDAAGEEDASRQDNFAPSDSVARETGRTHERASFLWLTETDDGELVRDDSDLLVVEDEMSVETPIAATGIDSEESTVSVDFQAMLNRMRAS